MRKVKRTPPNAMRLLSDNHIQAYEKFLRAPDDDASRKAENAMQEALDAILTYACTSEDDAWYLYAHLHWYEWKEGDRMEPAAKALFAAMRHTPGKLVLPPPAANDRVSS